MAIKEQVYFLDYNKRILLYDYSLGVGDTFQFINNVGDDTFQFHIKSIFDSSLNNGKSYKMYNLYDSSSKIDMTWIKGLGSYMNYKSLSSRSWMMYDYRYDFYIFEGFRPFPKLICDEGEVYRNTWQLSWADCDTAVLNSIILNNPKAAQVVTKLHPNPCNDLLYISSEQEFNDYSILNMQGKVLQSGFFSEVINTVNLSAGFYLLKLSHSSGEHIVKFVKQ